MQIVIDIPEYIYKLCQGHRDIVYKYIAKGKLLPKSHGRLIILSEDAIKKEYTSLGSSCQSWISDVGLSNATVAIIEADGEVANGMKYIPFLMHKEMDIPLSECRKAYEVAIDYLRSQGKVKG